MGDDWNQLSFLHAQLFVGMTLEAAVAKAEQMEATPDAI